MNTVILQYRVRIHNTMKLSNAFLSLFSHFSLPHHQKNVFINEHYEDSNIFNNNF